MTATGDEGNTADAVDAFIARWTASGAGEVANFQTFAREFCDLIGAQSEIQSWLAGEPLGLAALAHEPNWPSGLPDQMQYVKAMLNGATHALPAEKLAAGFMGARRRTAQDMLPSLTAIRQTHQTEENRYAVR